MIDAFIKTSTLDIVDGVLRRGQWTIERPLSQSVITGDLRLLVREGVLILKRSLVEVGFMLDGTLSINIYILLLMSMMRVRKILLMEG
jgi:hypothetical protein